MKGLLADVADLIPPTVMAILFVCLIVTILRAQNPQRRAAQKQREGEAEAADPRIQDQPSLLQAAQAERRKRIQQQRKAEANAPEPADRTPDQG